MPLQSAHCLLSGCLTRSASFFLCLRSCDSLTYRHSRRLSARDILKDRRRSTCVGIKAFPTSFLLPTRCILSSCLFQEAESTYAQMPSRAKTDSVLPYCLVTQLLQYVDRSSITRIKVRTAEVVVLCLHSVHQLQIYSVALVTSGAQAMERCWALHHCEPKQDLAGHRTKDGLEVFVPYRLFHLSLQISTQAQTTGLFFGLLARDVLPTCHLPALPAAAGTTSACQDVVAPVAA
mgnify:FL=1